MEHLEVLDCWQNAGCAVWGERSAEVSKLLSVTCIISIDISPEAFNWTIDDLRGSEVDGIVCPHDYCIHFVEIFHSDGLEPYVAHGFEPSDIDAFDG